MLAIHGATPVHTHIIHRHGMLGALPQVAVGLLVAIIIALGTMAGTMAGATPAHRRRYHRVCT